MLKCSQLCAQWFWTDESVFVCVVPVGFRASSRCFCIHTPSRWRAGSTVWSRSCLTFASHSFTPCLSLIHTEWPLWLQRFWWIVPLPHHMMEHCSAAPAPGPPGRLRDSMSKLKPGGWRRGRRNRKTAVIFKLEDWQETLRIDRYTSSLFFVNQMKLLSANSTLFLYNRSQSSLWC